MEPKGGDLEPLIATLRLRGFTVTPPDPGRVIVGAVFDEARNEARAVTAEELAAFEAHQILPLGQREGRSPFPDPLEETP